MNSNSIIETINSMFGNLFSSIDATIYSALDNITFINTDILNSYYFEKIFGTTTSNGFLLIANALLIGFVLYYGITYLLSSLGIIQDNIRKPSQFFFKVLLGGLLMNSSLFICEELIYLNSLISDAIRFLGHELLGGNICFSELINQANAIIFLENNSSSIFSIDGILKMIFSFSFFNIIFSYSVRYIMIKVFILISPFAFLSLSTPSTSVFFKCWIKSFLALLFIELLASTILIVMFSITYSSKDITSKLLLIGALFALIRSNSYIRELIGGINTEISDSMYMLRTFMK
ncbi:MAG: hypothetical protein HFJ19_01155 [Clostridia bacterium]|nr:hypothetical protein [Clostridia bacterium]